MAAWGSSSKGGGDIQVPASPAPARVPRHSGPTGGVQTRALGPGGGSAFSPEVVVDYIVVCRGRGVPAVQNELVGGSSGGSSQAGGRAVPLATKVGGENGGGIQEHGGGEGKLHCGRAAMGNLQDSGEENLRNTAQFVPF